MDVESIRLTVVVEDNLYLHSYIGIEINLVICGMILYVSFFPIKAHPAQVAINCNQHRLGFPGVLENQIKCF